MGQDSRMCIEYRWTGKSNNWTINWLYDPEWKEARNYTTKYTHIEWVDNLFQYCGFYGKVRW